MIKTAFFTNAPANIDTVYAKNRRTKIEKISDCYPHIITEDTFERHAEKLRDVEAIFSTWGMWKLTDDQLARLPNLKAVFYGAGSVKAFAGPLLERDIIVWSAWGANGIPVAEYTLAQILLATKGFFPNVQSCASPATRPNAFRGPGNFGETVALLGAGMIGQTLIGMLKNFELKLIVWDIFLSAADAKKLGVEKVDTLAEAFERGLVVSNHLANVPETENLLDKACFSRMRPNATFINTGRGATVNESDLIDIFKRRPDLTALLDVTHPEPPLPDSEFYTLPNIHLTSHIAGSIGDEVVRMGDSAIEGFEAWQAGQPLQFAVTQDMLKTMA